MEVTPKTFREIQFREKLRSGYHPEDVDEFLEQAAVGVEQLLERLREANERAQRAEAMASEASASDEVLKRTLVLAQRTADQAVSEAREEAERLLAEARTQAEALLAEGTARAGRAYEEAVAEGRAIIEKTTASTRRLGQESQALQDWVSQHRAQLLTALREAQALIENAGLTSAPPLLSEIADGPDAVLAMGPDGMGEPDQEQPVTVSVENGPLDEEEGAGRAPSAHGRAAKAARDEAPTVAPSGADPTPAAGKAPASDGLQSGAAPGEPGGGAMALDERALDSFFSEEDLAEEHRRGGRLRRHR